MDRSFVTCPACSQVFSEPRELPCRDSLCLACFRSLPADASGGRRCPVCGDLCQLSPEQLRPDAKTSQLVMLFRMAGGASAAADTDQRCSQLNCSALSVSGCGPVSRMSVCDAHLQSELQQLSSKLARLAESHGRLEPTRKRIVSAKWRLEHDLRAVEESLAEMQEMLDNARSSLVGEMSVCHEQVTTCLQNLDKVDKQVAKARSAATDQQLLEVLMSKSLLSSFDSKVELMECPFFRRRVQSIRLLLHFELSCLRYRVELSSETVFVSLNAKILRDQFSVWSLHFDLKRTASRLPGSVSRVHRRLVTSSNARSVPNKASAVLTSANASFRSPSSSAASAPAAVDSNLSGANPMTVASFTEVSKSSGSAFADAGAQVRGFRFCNAHAGTLLPRASGLSSFTFGASSKPAPSEKHSKPLRLTVCGNTGGFYSDPSGQVTSSIGSSPLPVECLVVLQANQPDSLLLIDCQNPASRFRCQLTGWDEKPSDLCWVPDGPRLALASAAASMALADLDGSVAHSGRADQLRKLTGLAANADKVFVAGLAADGRRCVACFSAQCLQLQTVIELHNEPSAAVAHGSAVMYGISLCGSGLLFSDPSDGRLRHHCLATGDTSEFLPVETAGLSAAQPTVLCADRLGLVFHSDTKALTVFLPDGRLLQSIEYKPALPCVSSVCASSDRLFVAESNSAQALVFIREAF